jgi:3-methyladenine DNA glycosylase/8-oxoguanine DNA glycosylase
VNKMILKYVSSLELNLLEPFSFELTVHKPAGWHWSTPSEKFRNGKFWSGFRLHNEPVGLKMQAAANIVRADIYGQEPTDEDYLIAIKRELGKALGEEEDIKGFYEFARSEPILNEAVDHLRGMRMGRIPDFFGRVILAICLQMAPLKRSRQMMDMVLSEFGTLLEFDRHEVRIWPQAAEIVGLAPSALRQKAKLGYRAERLVNAANYLVSGPISLDKLDSLSDEEARKMVMNIPGVGEYSAGILLGRKNVPVDSWSLVILSELFLGGSPANGRGDIPAVKKLIEQRWGRWGRLAFAYIVNDLPYLARKYRLSRIY